MALLIALVIITAFLAFSLVNQLFVFIFLYIEYSLLRLEAPDLYKAATIKNYAKNFCREFIYVTGKFYLYPYKFFNLTEHQAKNSTAILLIHGYTRNQSDWLWFIKQLSELKYPIYTINLRPTFGSIQEIVSTSIKDKIEEIKEQTQCQDIILICHSMGGLVASYYSEFSDDAGLVKKIITMATPFYGTKISIVATGENAKQMIPEAKFTEELRDKISKSSRKYYQVATQFDNIVFPWRSELLEFTPKVQQLVLNFESHLGLLHSKVVVKQVIDWIQD